MVVYRSKLLYLSRLPRVTVLGASWAPTLCQERAVVPRGSPPSSRQVRSSPAPSWGCPLEAVMLRTGRRLLSCNPNI